MDAYEGIRNFEMGIDGFELTLDCTTGYNEKGYSRETRTYLDGVFGFLVHWKSKHVMTIGFSIADNRRILLQQVQAKSKTGNRWMFKLPANRMEFIIDRLSQAFPLHQILIADGADYAKRSLTEYTEAMDRRLPQLAKASEAQDSEETERLAEHVEILREKIATIKRDTPRLVALYRDLGRYVPGKTFEANGMRHYALAA